MKIKWDCPSCKTKDALIEEIMADVTVASIINSIDPGEIQYGEQTNSDGSVVRYQCVGCGHKICRSGIQTGGEITDQEELFEWLKSRGCLHE